MAFESYFDLMMSEPIENILKGVSRSFYLSMRFLPKKIRPTISIAYLLARAADTISDTQVVPVEKRIQYLDDFRLLIEHFERSSAKRLQENLEKDLGHHNHALELSLLKNLYRCFLLYEDLSPAYQQHIQKVLLTLTKGMKEDLDFFSGNNGNLRCLKTFDDMERYTYLVAGCVGEFWTEVLFEHYSINQPKEWMIQNGVQYGKGLQLINILRDLPRDIHHRRCYLPESELKQFDISLSSIESYVNSTTPAEFNEQFMNLYSQKIELAKEWLSAGVQYGLSIPRRFLRLRITALLPVMIGAATLKKLEKSKEVQMGVKITRNQVYWILLLTTFFGVFNTPMKLLYRSLGGLSE